ncbi:YbaB/EbfC family nucleoid-associated protein [Nocardia veterana]|uniref:YbaB/EbfC family nucleoid-associated protein n=1 Tax=Nocardia veterana TaxID=132249 RepID=A0A7X6RKI7_9NOCA|nr:YbaB/EbfC family nucleoid-associated protein [Nocardia veterana]
MYESFDELETSVRKRLYRLHDLADGMRSVRAVETSPDGAVTVAVDGDGALVNLEFAQSVSSLTPEEFERRLVDTAAAAVRRAFTDRAALITAFNEEAGG